jgi:hypothetical protein
MIDINTDKERAGLAKKACPVQATIPEPPLAVVNYCERCRRSWVGPVLCRGCGRTDQTIDLTVSHAA